MNNVDRWMFESEDWFAWRPVRTVDGKWQWWTWVFRRRRLGWLSSGWEYL